MKKLVWITAEMFHKTLTWLDEQTNAIKAGSIKNGNAWNRPEFVLIFLQTPINDCEKLFCLAFFYL